MKSGILSFAAISIAVFLAFFIGMSVSWKQDLKRPDWRSSCSLGDDSGRAQWTDYPFKHWNVG